MLGSNTRIRITVVPGGETIGIAIITSGMTISMRGSLPFERGLEFLKKVRELKEDNEHHGKLFKLASKFGLEAPMR